jgi:6-phosphofructokinase
MYRRVMGRTASHTALECALQTHPNVVGCPLRLWWNALPMLDDLLSFAFARC